MRLERKITSFDYKGPVLRVYYYGEKEAFEVGRLSEILAREGLCAWSGEGYIQFPLMLSDSGLATPFPPGERDSKKVLKTFYVFSEDSEADLFTDSLDKGPEKGLLYTIRAATREEALAIWHLREGKEPYIPPGEPKICSTCGAKGYPDGSGDCWRCP